MDLSSVATVVTGGASGLGAATARAFAKSGARVAVLDQHDAQAREVASEIGGAAYACDVASAESAERALAAAAAAHGPTRVVVHCAGIGGAKRIVGRDGPMPLPEFERTIRVNLVGTFNILRLAATAMSRLEPLDHGERGVVVCTASIAAYEGQIGQAAYAASKGGIVALTLPAARELAQFGIRVVTIAPGLFLTPLLAELPREAQESLAASIPFPRRLGAPEEFARLAGDIVANPALNGSVIRIDGALRMAPR